MVKMIDFVKILQLIAIVQLSHYIVETSGANVVLQNYKPLAMDESWSMANRGGYQDKFQSLSLADNLKSSEPIVFEGSRSKVDSLLMDDLRSRSFDDSSVDIVPLKRRGVGSLDPLPLSASSKMGQVLEVESDFNADTKTNLFREPMRETSTLTKLLTRQPTFIRQYAVKPEMFNSNGTGKVLATYKFIVPIYIPAVKKLAIKPAARREPPKFVKETITEMVPVTQNVPTVKEVIKAVKVPQKVITDFVEARGDSIPQQVDDKVRPGEKVISTVVNNYD